MNASLGDLISAPNIRADGYQAKSATTFLDQLASQGCAGFAVPSLQLHEVGCRRVALFGVTL